MTSAWRYEKIRLSPRSLGPSSCPKRPRLFIQQPVPLPSLLVSGERANRQPTTPTSPSVRREEEISSPPEQRRGAANPGARSMDLFARAKAVRLKSHHDKFLYADEDEVHVTQDRDGASASARWTVELIPHSPGALRLRSRYGLYLTASNEPFLLGMTGCKVLQTAPARPDSSVEWEPVRDGFQARLKTRYGNFLRANGGLPPWRNSVTHDVPHRTATQDWVLWDVEIVQVLTPGPERGDSAPPDLPASPPPPELARPQQPHAAQHRPSKSYAAPPLEPRLSKLESSDSFSVPLHKVEGRAIHYHIADDMGNVEDDEVEHSFTFNGSSLEELTYKLQELTGLDGIIICTRSPINGKLIPLRLQLPPNNAAMHIVIVLGSSRVAKTFLQ